jgi:SAM-dependent methyltransferase
LTGPVFSDYARYYDLLYRDKDYVAEAAFVHGLLAEHRTPAGTILELGCGTGGHAVPLARHGYSVTGYDLSSEMVAEARARAPEELNEQLEFRVGDVCTLDAGRQFDAAVSLFHVASYQTGDDSIAGMFATAARHLRPGGTFLFDFWYGPAVLSQRPSVRVKRLQAEDIEVLRIAEPVEHMNENCVDVNYTVFVMDRVTGAIRMLEETHSMRYFFLPELRLLLSMAGFSISRQVEWLSGSDPSEQSWSVTIVATRDR